MVVVGIGKVVVADNFVVVVVVLILVVVLVVAVHVKKLKHSLTVADVLLSEKVAGHEEWGK